MPLLKRGNRSSERPRVMTHRLPRVIGVQEAVAWGNEGGAQVLDGPGKAALDEAMQLVQQVQDKLNEYVTTVDQAKGAGGG